jgi:hypothetical protein
LHSGNCLGARCPVRIFGQATGHPDWDFRSFSQSLQVNSGTIRWDTFWMPLFKSSPTPRPYPSSADQVISRLHGTQMFIRKGRR